MKQSIKNSLLTCFLAGLISTGAWAQNAQQFGGLNRYAESNAKVAKANKSQRKAVFMGNSITQNWASMRPDFFSKNGYVGRGISGQTSYQFLLRFREDVINLHPRVVVINAATNDIAENTGPYNEEYTFGNIISMVELAQAARIKVILTTTLPAAAFGWRPAIKDAPQKIASLNKRLQAYAKTHHIPFVDYYAAMVRKSDGALDPSYTKDGVHPTDAGYVIMEGLVKPVVEKLLK